MYLAEFISNEDLWADVKDEPSDQDAEVAVVRAHSVQDQDTVEKQAWNPYKDRGKK